MTEVAITAEPTATALATHLTVAKLAAYLVPYLGALTPQSLDAPERETEALLRGAAVHDLGWLRRIAVRGEDRFRWLSGMVTNGVESLTSGGDFGVGAYNLVLNAQGRIQGDCYVWRDGDELEIEVAADQYDALMAHFDRFIIMDDVELVPVQGQSALGLTGPDFQDILATLRLPNFSNNEMLSFTGVAYSEGVELEGGIPVRFYRSFGTAVPHFVMWTATEYVPALWKGLIDAGAKPVGAASLESLRIVEGIPTYGVDMQSRDLVQETSQMRAVSFTKGCYLGQEIVERVRSRGQVHRHLRSVELISEAGSELPAVGMELRVAGSAADVKPAGALTSVASLHLDGSRRIYGIAMIRAEAEVGSQTLTYPGGSARILNTPPKFISKTTA